MYLDTYKRNSLLHIWFTKHLTGKFKDIPTLNASPFLWYLKKFAQGTMLLSFLGKQFGLWYCTSLKKNLYKSVLVVFASWVIADYSKWCVICWSILSINWFFHLNLQYWEKRNCNVNMICIKMFNYHIFFSCSNSKEQTCADRMKCIYVVNYLKEMNFKITSADSVDFVIIYNLQEFCSFEKIF